MVFNSISYEAIEASKTAGLPKPYWSWEGMFEPNKKGLFPSTHATNPLYRLQEAIRMLEKEELQNVFARHDRHAEVTRRAVRALDLEVLRLEPEEYSSSLTAVIMSEFCSADHLGKVILDRLKLPLGNGLGKVAIKFFGWAPVRL